MNIIVSKNSGFCPGVSLADKKIKQLISDNTYKHVFTLGQLIHNEAYTAFLNSRGVRSVDIDELIAFLDTTEEPTAIVVRTHGITKEISSTLLNLQRIHPNFTVFDLTCVNVKKVQKIAEDNTSDKTVFLLYCDPSHPEAIGIMSYANGEKYAFSSLSDLQNIKIGDKTPILCAQTTQNSKEFEKIINFFKKLYTNAIFFDTICSVTEKRQDEAIRLAKNCDAMIVIGGRNSSNTNKLYDLCKINCLNTQLISCTNELDFNFFRNANRIGITAGASTPDGIILEVQKTMERENDFKSMLEDSLKTLHTGETVTGTVVTIGKNEIKLDLGTKFTGVLEKEQITDDPTADLASLFKIGDELEVFVIRVDDGKGIATVSKKRVDADNSWVVLKDAYDNGTVLEGKVVSVVKGGVILATKGNTVFIPASQTGLAKDADLSVLVGTVQRIKILEFNVQKKKALGSIKVVINEEKKAKEDAVWATLEVGMHFMGTVKNLTSYGAFVDIGGVDGMVHNSELSWKRIKHPSVVVSVGQVIDVFIKELDVEKRRISLGYKTQENDTWFQFTQKYKVGDVVSAKIVSVMPFGAFAEVYEDVDGLIHISRISTERINSPADVLKVGDVVDVKITEIDDENRKLALSMRAIKEEEERIAAEKQREADRAAAEAAAAEEAKRIAEERADMAPYIVGSI